jgi:4-amino-4-deoxy-L-arabinose transferase-like glycosyltransferase
VATHAALALLVTLQFGLQAKRGQIDMVLVFFTTLALWALARHLLRGRDVRLLLLGGLAAGIGTVTKGVGFLPLLLFLPWLALPSPLRGPALRSGFTWALAGFLAGTLVWLAPMLWNVVSSGDPALHAYARDILLRQTGQRYADPWHHHQPAWYYLQVILTLWLPGALLLPWLLPAWWRRLRRREPRQWLLLGWGALVLLFFTLSPAKREVYLLPALPAFCLAAAPLLPGLLRRRAVRLTLMGYVLVMSCVLLAIGALGLADAGGHATSLADVRGMVQEDASRFFAGALAIGALGLVLAVRFRVRRALAGVVLFTVSLWMGYGLVLAPALDASSSARAIMQGVSARLDPAAELGMIGWSEQHMLQAGRPVQDFGFSKPMPEQWTAAAAWLAAAPEKRWLFVENEAMSPCVVAELTIAAGRSNRRDWTLVPAAAWRDGCIAPPGS